MLFLNSNQNFAQIYLYLHLIPLSTFSQDNLKAVENLIAKKIIHKQKKVWSYIFLKKI